MGTWGRITPLFLSRIADRLGIPVQTADGKSIRKQELRKIIAARLNSNPGGHLVGKKMKCVVDGEEFQGTVVSVAESVEDAGRMIYKIEMDNGDIKFLFVEEFVLIEQ